MADQKISQLTTDTSPQLADYTTTIRSPFGSGSNRKVALSDLQTLMAANSVPTSRTVNGHALSSNVTVTATDVGLGSVTNTAQIPLSYLDTDGTLSANSDSKVASQKATKTYVDALTSSAVILQGDWNANTNSPDISGTTTTGYAWRVSVAGSTNLGGITSWDVNDLAVKTAGGWIKVDNSNTTAIWGNITGTLSNQSDLQSALDAKMVKANNLSDVASASTSRTNLGLGTLATQDGTFSGTSSGTNTGDQTITLTGDVTGSGTGSFAATIGASAVTTGKINAAAVTYAKIQNVSATSKLLGRSTSGAGVVEEITVGGDISQSGSAFTIGTSAVTTSKINNGAVTEAKITLADNTTNDVSTSAHGFAPKAPNDATKFLDGTGAYSTPPNSGGTVTTVSVVTANGVSGSVANASTTPAITLSLGAIVPTTVNSVTLSGSSTPTLAVTGTTTVSGSNTGDQDLSGLVVKANNLSDLASASTARTNLGLGTLATQSGTFSGTSSGTNTGDQVISDATISTSDITTNNVSTSKHGFTPKLPNDATKYLDGTGNYTVPSGGGGGVSGSGAANQMTYWSGSTAVTGDTGFTVDATNKIVRLLNPTGAGNGTAGYRLASTDFSNPITDFFGATDVFISFPSDVDFGGVSMVGASDGTQKPAFSFLGASANSGTNTLPILQFMAAKSDGSTGIQPLDATETAVDIGNLGTTLLTILGNGDSTFTGTLSASNLSGTNTGDQTITLTGNVTGSGTGSFSTTIANGVVTEAMQTLADNTTGNVSTAKHGYAPKAPNDATKYLDGTGAYSVPAGVSGSGASGQVSFWTGSSVVSGDNALYWNNSTKRLGIGTTNPSGPLDVVLSAGVDISIDEANTRPTLHFHNSGTSASIDLIAGDRFGIVAESAVPLAFATTGIDRMTIAADGKVGIGNSSPTSLLHVGSSADQGFVRIEGRPNGPNPTLSFDMGGAGEHDWQFINGATGTAHFDLYDYTADEIRMSFDGTGKAGFNNANSFNASLTLDGGTGEKISFYASEADGYVIGVESQEFRFASGNGGGDFITFYVGGYAGTEAVRITSDGDLQANNALIQSNGSSVNSIQGQLGIGTYSPSAKLHVNGDVYLDDITAPGTTTNKLYSVSGDLYWDGTQLNGGGGGGISGSGSSGQATFWNGSSSVTGDNAFFWDNTNKRLGIGLTNPTTKLEIKGSSNSFRFNPDTLGISSNSDGNGIFMCGGTEGNGAYVFVGGNARGDAYKDATTFFVGATEYMRIDGDYSGHTIGNVGIGTTTPAAKLHVVGNGLFTTGLQLQGASGANEQYQQGNADWNNPATDMFGAHTYFAVFNGGTLNGHPEYGGGVFGGLGDGTHNSGIAFFGVLASTTPTRPAVEVVGIKSDGGTGIAPLDATDLLCTMGTLSGDPFSFYAGGNATFDGSLRTAGTANKVRTVSSNTALDVNDGLVLVDTTGGNVTITLPAANAYGAGWGQNLIIKRISGGINTLTVAAGSGDTIQGSGSVSLVAQFASQQIQADGANTWYSLSVI